MFMPLWLAEGIYRPTTPFVSVEDANGFELYSEDSRVQERFCHRNRLIS